MFHVVVYLHINNESPHLLSRVINNLPNAIRCKYPLCTQAAYIIVYFCGHTIRLTQFNTSPSYE